MPEVRWLPLYTIALWPLSLGLATLALSADANRFAPGAFFVAVGGALGVLGFSQSRRRRFLVPRTGTNLVVDRAGRMGRAFCRLRVKISSPHRGISLAYALLGACMIQASTQQLRLGAPLSPESSAGAVAERFTAVTTGFFVAALCGIAIWRRLVCSRLRVPGERLSMWVRSDDLARLGMRDEATAAEKPAGD